MSAVEPLKYAKRYDGCLQCGETPFYFGKLKHEARLSSGRKKIHCTGRYVSDLTSSLTFSGKYKTWAGPTRLLATNWSPFMRRGNRGGLGVGC